MAVCLFTSQFQLKMWYNYWDRSKSYLLINITLALQLANDMGDTKNLDYCKVVRQLAEREGISVAQTASPGLQAPADGVLMVRTTEPQDVANIVTYLASDVARDIVGQPFSVKGCLFMM